ncbi:acyltransferase [Sphingomonas sanguinis]|uniref:Acyltransferase n=1 Tax=Sphingomonas sanguinis TaxID=33051 RepID=A0ABU5LSU3_9SPHN|nr:acyltransferase [Sphingomonas sanguinis]MDZ7283005.1 acyltransferase [Sphingomonas sanguinis]
MLNSLLRRITGRSYTIDRQDLAYLMQKGARPMLRGALWRILRRQRPNGLMLGRGIEFVLSSRLSLGRGVSIGSYSYLDCSASEGVVLGNRVTIREHAWLQCRSGLNEPATGIVIGAGSYIGPNAVIGAGGLIEIGRNVQIGARFTVSAESHVAGADGTYTSGRVSRQGVRIGDDCWFGNNVSVLDGVTIGQGAVVGAGSVVTRSLPARSIAYGVPAKVVRIQDERQPASP